MPHNFHLYLIIKYALSAPTNFSVLSSVLFSSKKRLPPENNPNYLSTLRYSKSQKIPQKKPSSILYHAICPLKSNSFCLRLLVNKTYLLNVSMDLKVTHFILTHSKYCKYYSRYSKLYVRYLGIPFIHEHI